VAEGKKKRRGVGKRNRENYNQFRKKFKEWFWRYKFKTKYAKLSTEAVTFYLDNGKHVSYFAPDYTKYMRRMCRGLLK
jgi:hypothetical protein